MARLRGRSPRGERCRGAVPRGHWKATTFTAGLRLGGMATPVLLDGPMNGDALRAYAEQVLAPELRCSDVAVMGTLPSLRVGGIREAIEATGAKLLFLPPYSPDFNPIEMAFPKTQGPAAEGRRANHRRALGHHRQLHQGLLTRRVQKLLPGRRI